MVRVLGITHSVDMISLILLQKHVKQYVERKNEIIHNIGMQHKVENYLFALNQYYSVADSEDKSYLKTALSEFHHVLPNLSSFMFTLVCCSVPLLSSGISSRILSNICRIQSETNCLRAVTILLKRLSGTEQCRHVQKALSELIFRGLEGTEQDQIKSILVLKAEVRGFEDNPFVPQDLIKVIDYVCDACPVLSDTHPVITELQQCIKDSHNIPPVSQHICDILLEGKSASTIVHSVDLLLELYQYSSILLDNLYQLLLGINTRFSSFNSDLFVHSRLLRILSVLCSFEGLEPTFEDKEKAKGWESARKEYELFSHRIVLFCSLIVGFDDYSLPFTPIVPLRLSSLLPSLNCRYQMEGIKWLLRNCMVGISSGGILGDEMGLGKTIQAAIAVLCCDENYPSLVVTPKSLLLNWKVEIQKFIPADFVSIILYFST